MPAPESTTATASASASAPFGTGPVSALALTTDELHFAAAVDRNYVQVSTVPVPTPTPSTSAPTLPVTADFVLHKISTPSITALAFPQRSALYVADSRGALTRYSTDNLRPRNSEGLSVIHPDPVFTIPAAHSGSELTAVAAASAETPAVTGGKDGTVRVWDVEKYTALRKLTGHRYEVRALAVSSDNGQGQSQWTGLIASGGRDRTVRLWDARAREGNTAAVHVFSGHSGWVHGVALAETSDPFPTVVSVSGDKTVRVWDLRTLRLRAAYRGHQYRIWDVAVASRAAFAVSGSTDASVRIWPLAPSTSDSGDANSTTTLNANDDQQDPVDGAELAVLEMHRDSVIAVSAASDGRFILSACEDGSVLTWRPPIATDSGAVEAAKEDQHALDVGTRSAESVEDMTKTNKTVETDQDQLEDAKDETFVSEGKLLDIEDETVPLRPSPPSYTVPKIMDTTPLLNERKKALTHDVHSAKETRENQESDENNIKLLLAASSERVEQTPTYDRAAAELVGALSRVRDLEQSLQASNKQLELKSNEITALKVEVRRRDAEISRLSTLLEEARRVADAASVRDALLKDERKADIPLDYDEPVNKIGAVSDQLTKLAARLDAMIATS